MTRPYKPADQARRYAENEAELRAAGGKRVNVRLRSPAVKALERLMKKHGTDQTETINAALVSASQSKA
jgi:RNA:NAD 2'-phosphotransferase (TPT1/KptA family)